MAGDGGRRSKLGRACAACLVGEGRARGVWLDDDTMRVSLRTGVLWVVLLTWSGLGGGGAHAVQAESPAASPWRQLILDAQGLGLPVQFLRLMPEEFVSIEFEDLHTYAAEYHPEDHRMVLNRTLSFNAAGSVLRPLRMLHHRDVGTLFHELFHAYMDYLVADPAATSQDPHRRDLLGYARDRQFCRYTNVQITPVVQRKHATEPRELTERESWEALNETWAVFVGWAVWTKLEAVEGRPNGQGLTTSQRRDWFARLARANERGELRAYYEPEDAEERALTKKRYLSHAFRIGPDEARALMHAVMEVSEGAAEKLETLLKGNTQRLQRGEGCQGYPVENQADMKK